MKVMIAERDKFNSEIFQMRMGNLKLENYNFESVEEFCKCEKSAVSGHYDHLALRIPTNEKSMINIAISSGYSLVDILVEFVFKKDTQLLNIQHKCVLRDCDESDLPELKRIARCSFKHDRFHSDSNLKKELCDLYYEKWMENSFYGFADRVIVAEYDGNPVGFTTAKKGSNNENGHLVLSAVSEEYRGIGIYTSMIHEGVSWIMKENPEVQGIIVGTQIDNINVMKAWIKLGFTIYDSKIILHKYLKF